MRNLHWYPVAAGLVVASVCSGGEPASAQEAGEEGGRPTLYAGLSGVLLYPNPDERVMEPEGRRFGYGLLVGYPLHDRISLSAEFLWLGRDYRRLHALDRLPNASDNRLRALTMAFLANARIHQPVGPVTLEFGAGVGTGGTSLFISAPDGGGFTTDGAPGAERGLVTQWSLSVVTPGPLGAELELGWRRISLEHDFGIYSGDGNEFGADCLYLALRGGWSPG